jgi:apolipoprotein N-acyltransferase
MSESPAGDIQFPQRRPGIRCSVRAAFLFLSVGLLTLAFAPPPIGQCWLAWVALAPWIIAVSEARSAKAAFLWGWVGGIFFFAANMWWLWTATIPGTVVAVVYLALFWGVAGAVTHRVGVARVATIAAVWCGAEWLRALASGGFPWLLIGHSQSRFPLACQVADVCGVYGVSFLVVATNALVAVWIVERRIRRTAAMIVAAILIVAAGYGAFRLHQTTQWPGPRVMVVQSNLPFGRGGVRTASREATAEFHLATTADALQRDPDADLVVWSEAVMPPLNAEAREELRRAPVGQFLASTHRRIAELRVPIVTGGYYVGGWTGDASKRSGTDIRNSVFFYRDGAQSPLRYDKIELVPFAERMPFAWAPAWTKAAMLWLAAPSARQPDTPGDANALTTFEIASGARFVTPICFENVDGPFVARMLRAPEGGKSADFIVNLTNDGWFAAVEHEHHFRNITFRAIENRVPIVRASNTGISGFVDSCGRVIGTLPTAAAGTLAARLPIDERTTIYTCFGDVFAIVCSLCTLAVLIVDTTRRRKRV